MSQTLYAQWKAERIANLPPGMTYNDYTERFIVNGKPFPTYQQAKWYQDYIFKYGDYFGVYNIGENTPQIIADFSVGD